MLLYFKKLRSQLLLSCAVLAGLWTAVADALVLNVVLALRIALRLGLVFPGIFLFPLHRRGEAGGHDPPSRNWAGGEWNKEGI